MKKFLLLNALIVSAILLTNFNLKKSMSFYDFEFKTLEGESFSFNELKGKRVLIVNTASKCGYTSQYKELQELYEKYKDSDFVIVGFPSNNFGGQEPGSDAEINSFCEKNYGVTFPVMSKSDVVGDNQNELYKWLSNKDMNQVDDGAVKWNFHKFLIDENGNYVSELGSSVSPLDKEIVSFASGK